MKKIEIGQTRVESQQSSSSKITVEIPNRAVVDHVEYEQGFFRILWHKRIKQKGRRAKLA